MPLKLPLRCYDETGVVLPPTWFYLLLILGCRDLILVCLFSALPQQETVLYSLFFPDSSSLWIRLVTAMPFVAVVAILGMRKNLWRHNYVAWRNTILPLCWLGVLSQLLVIGYLLNGTEWAFNGYFASALSGLVLFAYLLVHSHHLRVMVNDWQTPPQNK